jgi:dihydroorotate dehydrogenase electron transfer subunit
MDKPQMVEITDVKILSSEHRVFTLDLEVESKPGQFCMLWIPEVNEKPMSLSNVDGNLEVTVKKRGRFTTNMFMMEPGSKIGFRGPYGRGFEKVSGEVCLVGGGCGIAPLRPLKDRLRGHAIVSARTETELLFEDDFQRAGFEVHVATDDGSRGHKAFASQVLEELLETEDFSSVYACGPEAMLKKTADICGGKKIPTQLSLERYMKCGIGLCGSCSISGMRVCKEGPVFYGSELTGTEFGKYSRDGSGSRRGCNGC